MAQAGQSPEELRAAQVVRRLLQAAYPVEWRDVGGVDGMYDFDVVNASREVVASVEVTIIADEAHRRTWNEKTLGPLRHGAPLQHGWSVTFWRMETVPLKKTMRKVHEQLQLLEAAGRTELDASDADGDDPVRSALSALGVMSVEVFDDALPGTIVLSSVDSGVWGWHDLEDAIEECAEKKARQLARADPEVERILFLWISDSRQDLLAAFDRWTKPEFGPPPRTLVLSDVIDTVIVGLLDTPDDRFYRWPGFSPFSTGNAVNGDDWTVGISQDASSAAFRFYKVIDPVIESAGTGR